MNTITPVNLANYARRNGFKTAAVKAKDGSEFRIFDNMKDTFQVFRFKDNELLEAQGFVNRGKKAFIKNILDVIDKIKVHALEPEDLSSKILRQLIEK